MQAIGVPCLQLIVIAAKKAGDIFNGVRGVKKIDNIPAAVTGKAGRWKQIRLTDRY